MSSQAKPFFTEEQYLEMEEHSEQRSEFLHGEIYPMEAVTFQHSKLSTNLMRVLFGQLASGCEPHTTGLRVKSPRTGLYTYPDIAVMCGKPEILEKDKWKGTVTNPKVIVEILSPSTQSYDRGDKFVHYRSIPSLCEYLLISQDKMQAEHWIKQPDGDWLFHEVAGPDEVVSLQSIGVSFPLREAYDGVEL